MPVIRLTEPAPADIKGWRPLGLGFRPFFLLAGVAAVVLMALWLWLWQRGTHPAAYYGPVAWHSHEMLFGYTVAVVSGFLLTAVRNWTGHPTPTGAPLALLALIWVAGRLAPWVPVPAPVMIAALDMALLPALAIALASPLWNGANRVNRVFLPLLLAMATANGLVHAEALGWTSGTAMRGTNLMLDLVVLLLVFVGGRVIPFFTEKAVGGARPVRRQWVETAGFVLVVLLGVFHVAGAPPQVAGTTLLAAGATQAVRLAGWHDSRAWRIPVLWVLYTGYAWLVAGLFLRGLAAFGVLPDSSAVHALTAGGFGVLTLGMMARVALGHTGRSINTAASINVAFVIVNVAAVVRVAGPWGAPSLYSTWILLAGILWLSAFAIFVVKYAPILMRPRIDGRPD